MIGHGRLVDGGLVGNSPILAARSEAAVLWPGAHVDCVVSVGSGTMTTKLAVYGALSRPMGAAGVRDVRI